MSVDHVVSRIRSSAYTGPFEPDWADARRSAVLVVLAEHPEPHQSGGAHVLLTRRSMQLSSHQGEVSFPGGRLDAGETYEEAALREAFEEVGLPPEEVTVVSRLSPISTWVSSSWIVPVVATVARPIPLEARTGEVDRVLWTPLHDLTRPGTYREELWHTVHGEHPIYFFELDDETVWGATARMLHEVLRAAHDVVRREPPAV